MRIVNIPIVTAIVIALSAALLAEEVKPKPAPNVIPFAWPFLTAEEMSSRGGSTKGSRVTLDPSPSDGWKRLQTQGLGQKEKDRLAILAIVGQYRVSFQFVETMGFTEDYHPAKPYFSWGTEEVRVLEASDEFISLQHTLVMYFKTEEGKVEGPMVMKHWRQDWSWQDTKLHTYQGELTWAARQRSVDSVEGTWTQAVYQVDDSPRYEVAGRWSHAGGVSSWKSEDCWRPLPRREFSVRDDYNVLAGSHSITITPRGWVHGQDNRKLVVDPGKEPTSIASEIGISRYERITEPSLTTGANEYWSKTGAYWKEVRKAWTEVSKTEKTFRLKPSDQEKKLYQVHFGYAAKLEQGEEYNAAEARKHASDTIDRFLKK